MFSNYTHYAMGFSLSERDEILKTTIKKTAINPYGNTMQNGEIVRKYIVEELGLRALEHYQIPRNNQVLGELLRTLALQDS